MSIKICSGLYRSRKIICPSKGVRPTSERVKEAMFSTLLGYVDGSIVLDLFSGSGNLGIEALSRGAKEVTFVDKSRKCINTIYTNLDYLGTKTGAHIVHLGAMGFIRRCKDRFNLIFMDPPYNKGLAQKTAYSVLRLLEDDGILVIEHSSREEIDIAPHWKRAYYGDTCVTYIKRKELTGER